MTSRIELDYPLSPSVRFGYGKPVHSQIAKILAEGDERFSGQWRRFADFSNAFAAIEQSAAASHNPSWVNDWISPLDAISLYGFAAQRNPEIFLEVGSGMSTKFVARAIRDQRLRTKIVSIDPNPRSEIDALCSSIIRAPLEQSDLSVFATLQPNDMVFFDGSHRSFPGSDATVFFLEVLPTIPPGVLVGIHDIFLPHDYPEAWLPRFYNEQYLLACWLLGGGALRVELPVYYCSTTEHARGAFDPMLDAIGTQHPYGGAFWVTRFAG
jgi:predicted O-methyltransferase YrrM